MTDPKSSRRYILENEELKDIIKKMWFMAKRYAQGRDSYAPMLMDYCTRRAIELGVDIQPDPVDGKLYFMYVEGEK
jgi:hypothetical protein